MSKRGWGRVGRIRQILVPRCYPEVKLPGCFPDRRTPRPGCYPSGGGSDEGKHPAPSNLRMQLALKASRLPPLRRGRLESLGGG